MGKVFPKSADSGGLRFEQTGREWGKLATNLNSLLETTGPDGVNTIERSAVALEQFTRTMKTAEETLAAAGSLISDPRYQQQLQATLTALPELLNETRGTLRSVNQVIRQVPGVDLEYELGNQCESHTAPQGDRNP